MDMKELLQLAVNQKASDLHILPNLPPMIRIHGDLIPIKEMPVLTAEAAKELLFSVMTAVQQESFEKTLECDMSLVIPQIGNFRMSAMHQLHGIAGIFRVISETIPTFEELSLPPILKSLSILPHGLILVTGPTGSGKSTTLASMIDFINTTRSCNIITIEDPIEYIYHNKKSLIHQRQIHRDTLSGATALRSALRQDPDVILLGEMRDLDTIRLALTAAETGHLVMTTLHASSAPLAISRMIDAFPNDERNRVRNLLAETIQGVVCQTLVKKAAGGRIGAFEIMLATPAIRHMIREDKIPHMVMTIQTNGDMGMMTLDQSLEILVQKNIITIATARSAAMNKDWFA